MLLVTFFC